MDKPKPGQWIYYQARRDKVIRRFLVGYNSNGYPIIEVDLNGRKGYLSISLSKIKQPTEIVR